MGILDSIYKPLAKPFGLDDAFEDKVTPASPEAAELKAIKLQGARGQGQALDIFRKIYEQDPSVDVKSRINLENLMANRAAQKHISGIQERLRQSGLSSSSMGLQAMAGREPIRDMAMNKASFRKRLGGEKERRLENYRGTAAQTLSGTDIGTRFNETKEGSLFKNLVTGAGVGFAGSLGSALGSGAAGGSKKKTAATKKTGSK